MLRPPQLLRHFCRRLHFGRSFKSHAAGLRLAAYVELVAPPPAGAGAATGAMQGPRLPGPAAAAPDDLRRWCAERLPPSAVPSAVAVLPRLPRSAAGKLARGALPPPAWAAPGSAPPDACPGPWRAAAVGGGGGAPGAKAAAGPAAAGSDYGAGAGPAAGGGWEARTLCAFAQALALPRLEPAADFFAAGGDSLAAAAAAAALGVGVRQVAAPPLGRPPRRPQRPRCPRTIGRCMPAADMH